MEEESGLIKHWWKDWDKMRMWKALGWVRPDNDQVEFARAMEDGLVDSLGDWGSGGSIPCLVAL
jgi:hypothetical protein